MAPILQIKRKEPPFRRCELPPNKFGWLPLSEKSRKSSGWATGCPPCVFEMPLSPFLGDIPQDPVGILPLVGAFMTTTGMLPARYSALVPVLCQRASQTSRHSANGFLKVAKKLWWSNAIHAPVKTGWSSRMSFMRDFLLPTWRNEFYSTIRLNLVHGPQFASYAKMCLDEDPVCMYFHTRQRIFRGIT